METKIIAIIAVLAIVISVLAVLVITEQRRYTSYVRYTQCQGLAGIGCALQENRGSVSGLVTYGAPILCGLGLLSGVFSFGLGTPATAASIASFKMASSGVVVHTLGSLGVGK